MAAGAGRRGRREPDPEDSELSTAFFRVAGRMRRHTFEALAPWDITPSQSRALEVLRRHGPMRLKDLSDHLRIAPRSGTEVVDLLQERGLVERRPDHDDRRATVVALTAQGDDVSAAIRTASRAATERYFGTLSAADRDSLLRILGALPE